MCAEQISIIQTVGLIFVGAMQAYFAYRLWLVSNQQKNIIETQTETSNLMNMYTQFMSIANFITDREDNAKLDYDREIEKLKSLLNNPPGPLGQDILLQMVEDLKNAQTNYSKRIQSVKAMKEELGKFLKSYEEILKKKSQN